MATSATITAKCKDGKYRQIYCHYDGYIKGVGKTLFDHFQNQDKIEKLMELGDISILAENIDCPDGHFFKNPIEGYTIAYGRDRGENNTECFVDDSLIECGHNKNLKQYINYFWDGKQWFVAWRYLSKGNLLSELFDTSTDNEVYDLR